MADSPAKSLLPLGREINYRGVRIDNEIFPSTSLDKIVDDLEFSSDDILLAGYPKTGNTWLHEIVWLICNDVDKDGAQRQALVDRVWMLELCFRGGKPYIDKVLGSNPPRLMTTHLPHNFFSTKIKNGKPKVIYIMRNPKDTFVSMFHFYNMRQGIVIPTFDDFFELIRSGKIVFGDFFDHVVPWWTNQKQDNILIVNYEDMKKDPTKEVKRMAEYLEKDLTVEQIEEIVNFTNFTSMRSRKGLKNGDNLPCKKETDNHFRKGEVGNWKDYFTEEHNRYIEEKHREKLKGTGLSFQEYL